MSLAHVEQPGPAPAPSGGVHFAAAPRQGDACAELRARRYLVTPVCATAPGRLRNAIDDAIEGSLALRGALPPCVDVEASIESTIRDQVFRARALGASGLALALPRISGAAGLLHIEDGSVLSAWIAASKRAPLVVLLDEADRNARVFAPVPLSDLAGPSPLSIAAREAVAVEEKTAPSSREALSDKARAIDAAPAVEAAPARERVSAAPPPVIALPRRGVMKRRSARMIEAPEMQPFAAEAEADTARAEQPSEPVATPMLAIEPTPAPVMAEPAPVVAAEALTPESPVVVEEDSHDPFAHPMSEPPCADPIALKHAAALMPPVPPIEEAPPVIVAPPTPPSPESARRVVDAAASRAHAVELDKARGPKPVSAIERLFTTRYVPLLGAIGRGEAEHAVRGVADAWRTSFEHSYREAFSALRVTGKRPPMVFDAPEIANRIARLNGARKVLLLLVDAMRFDIGERVAQHLHDRLTGRAVCVERMLLWSAIPTTTPAQLALLGRGPEGLRDADPPSDPEPEIVRGRAVGTVRRERVGGREVMKLDVVEARLRTAGPGYEERIDGLAEEVAAIVVRYVETLPPRTLFFLFGDHGFKLPASQDGRMTGPATQGGVSPEEVLVPGQAWLVGGVH